MVVCLATYQRLALRFSVCRAGGGPWLAHDASPLEVKVFDRLYFYFARIRPGEGKPKLPTGELLAYSIAVISGATPNYTPFERLVATDQLAYDPYPLPTFFLQRKGRPLNLLYGSCRKIHDTHGGTKDALAEGDSLIAKGPSRLDDRPALLVLGGDQIYADEVHQAVFQQVLRLAGQLEAGAPEALPGPPLGADRRTVLANVAKFTSDDLKTHVATLAEYLALYGLSWNQRCWTMTDEYKYDFESWAANEAQMAHVLRLLSGRNVVLLSGDVHYGYTSTVGYTVFDSRSLHGSPALPSPTGALPSVPAGALPSYRPVATSQILQLTSSALKNVAGGWKTRWPAGWSRTKPGKVVTEDGSVLDGHYENGHFVMVGVDEDEPPDRFGGLGPVRLRLAIRTPQEVRPVTAYRQRVNDEYNLRYLEDHNLGFVALAGPTVRHRFLTVSGPQSELTFDFSNPRYFA